MHLVSGFEIGEGSLESSLVSEVGADLAKDVIEEFRLGWQMDCVMAEIRQRNIAAATRNIEACTVEGLGQHVARIDLTAFLYWDRRTGGECWRDKTFLKEFLRDNPEARVKYRPRTTSLQVNGFRDQKQQQQNTQGGLVVCAR